MRAGQVLRIIDVAGQQVADLICFRPDDHGDKLSVHNTLLLNRTIYITTGHLLMSTLHTIDASKTVERIIGVFPLADQQSIRTRLGKAFRFIVSQRLIPKKDGKGRVAAVEILKATMRTRDYVEKGEGEGKTLLDAMRDGDTEGMQHFDGEIAQLVRDRVVDLETGLSFASNPTVLGQELAR